MIVTKKQEFNSDKEISDKEYKVINRFLEHYRDKNIIVADKHRVDIDIVPFEGEEVAFKLNEEHWKSMDFKRKIVYKGTPYIVRLGLWRVNLLEDQPKCLTIKDFEILSPGKKHVLTHTTDDIFKEKIFCDIFEIFDEKKIISPEAAHSKRMYTNKMLQEFMYNHEWGKIIEGVNQEPELANALFIIGDLSKEHNNFNAYFGTILYQLITYRNEHKKEFTRSDLLELDKVILALSKTELLKVHLRDSTGVSKVYPTGSVLLDWRYYSSQMRLSEQYTVGNGELREEKKSLYKVLSKFRNL